MISIVVKTGQHIYMGTLATAVLCSQLGVGAPRSPAMQACVASQPLWSRPELDGTGERNLQGLGWNQGLGWTSVIARGAGREPPPCLATQAICDKSATCSCNAAVGYHAHETSGQLADASAVKQLRVFFLDGHVGPLNDMVSLLVDVMGVNPANIDGMYFLQAHIMHSMLDKRI